MIRRILAPAVVLALVLAILCGLVYPISVWAIGQVAFNHRANGSFIKQNGKVIGSSIIGQSWENKAGNPDPRYFQPRPSAVDYNAAGSGASNLGPADARLIGFIPGVNITTKTNPYATPTDPTCVPVQETTKNNEPVTDKAGNPVYEKNPDGTYVCNANTVPQRLLAYRAFNHVPANVKVPVDAVTASDSGLDPDITPANAMLQAPRVAQARNLPLAEVISLVKAHTDDPQFGFLGEKTVNVLDLNLALDKLGK